MLGRGAKSGLTTLPVSLPGVCYAGVSPYESVVGFSGRTTLPVSLPGVCYAGVSPYESVVGFRRWAGRIWRLALDIRA